MGERELESDLAGVVDDGSAPRDVDGQGCESPKSENMKLVPPRPIGFLNTSSSMPPMPDF